MTGEWLDLGISGAALLVIVLLARGFFRMQNALMAHEKEQQEQVLAFFGNHLSDVVDTQAKVATHLQSLTNEIRAMRYELRSTGTIDSKVDTE